MGSFDHITVLEYGHLVAAPYCGKILADMGATVIKLEEPGCGDPARLRGPFKAGTRDPETSTLFLYLNTNKQSVTLDPRRPAGRDLLRQLACDVDVLIEDTTPGTLASWGLDYEALRAVNERLILTSVTPYGQTGPKARLPASDLTLFHGGGQGHTVRPSGQTDAPPLRGGGYLASYHGGLSAAVATLGALYSQGLTGRGQHVDVSVQEAVMALERATLTRAPNERHAQTARAGGRGGMMGLKRCQDGWVVIAALERHQWQGFMAAMGDPAWSHDLTIVDPDGRAVDADALDRHVGGWLMQHPMEEIYHRCEAHGVPAGCLNDSAAIFASKQLQERGFFQELDHPRAGRHLYPTAPFRSEATPWRGRRGAPLLGEQNDEVYGHRLGIPAPTLAALAADGVI